MSETVQDKKVVLIRYTLKGPDGTVIDTTGDEVHPYLHGAQNLVPGLEAALAGRAVGDSLEVEVAAADAYGERVSKPFQIPRDQFPADLDLAPGMDFVIENDAGEQRVHWVLQVSDEAVLVDGTHPLAGVDLSFEVEIKGIRDATADELDHGHPHGPDGHGGHHH